MNFFEAWNFSRGKKVSTRNKMDKPQKKMSIQKAKTNL